MALPIITPNDFTGWLKIVSNEFKSDLLQEYIDLFSVRYLKEIIGDAAFIDIEAQARQKWTDLLDGVDYVDVNDKRKRYNGIKSQLLNFIYFEFVRDNFTSTQIGSVKGKAENSDMSSVDEVLNIARSRYNQAVITLRTTQSFLEANAYFDEDITASVDNLDNTYTLSIPNTKYLEIGDSVSVEGDSYAITAVTTDANITIQADATGIDFSLGSVYWEPYEDVDFCEIEIAGI